jgi:hypothetical protein
MMVGEALMPATILPFERRQPAAVPPAPHVDSGAESAPAPPPLNVVRPFPVSSPAPITSRQVAHRWAMLSHLSRHSASWHRVVAPPGADDDPVP